MKRQFEESKRRFVYIVGDLPNVDLQLGLHDGVLLFGTSFALIGNSEIYLQICEKFCYCKSS